MCGRAGLADGIEIAFAGARIDRADHVRTDAEALEALKDWRARVLLLDGLTPRLEPDGGLAWGTLSEVEPGAELVFLGLADGRGHFAPVAPDMAGRGLPMVQLWEAISRLSPEDLATYGGARALVDWHARHRFCARCGAATAPAKGGWQRSCTNPPCAAEHFPRVDPVTIMIVEHEDRLLLGRQHAFPPGFYSALAGFIEPGEAIEEAVRREVFEEAGVRVGEVRYVASQPWPFPSSLMIGCFGVAIDAAIRIDANELDDARWFSRAEIAAGLAGGEGAPFSAPPPRAIAHQLLKWWLERG